ncbi:MAG: GyrI-like domain-containing protein [Nitrososphaerales archaeon]
MVVDIIIKRDRSYRVIVKGKVGPHSGDNNLRSEFRELVGWAKKNKIRTGKWLMFELDGPEAPLSKRRWEACLEVKGTFNTKPEDDLSFRRLPAQLVASVTFDPDQFSTRLVYHGLECWLEWRTKRGEMKEAGPTREVYIGDPWTNAKSWANTEVQVPVERINQEPRSEYPD